MNRPIGITIGDPAGIGPEVTLKALARLAGEPALSFRIFGDAELLRSLNALLGTGLPLHEAGAGQTGRFLIHAPPSPSPPQRGGQHFTPRSPTAAKAAILWLRQGAELCLRNELAALVTGPVNKEAIINSGESGFVGQTELLASTASIARPVMMLLGTDDRGRWLRVALATTHLPLREVASRLEPAMIETAIERAADACRDLGLTRARVGVCGLNPHAGEGGRLGDEELRIVTPAVRAAIGRGLDAHGPFAADTLFHQAYRGEFDAVVALYHDQGLVPLKMVAFESGVNWTLGLPFIRTSPDHGTAYDIAGQGRADESSTVAAIQLAARLAANRRP